MDFKKAYETALERAKDIYNGNPSSSTAKVVCGQIFPEIKESEDERIRKEIINYLSKELHNEKQLTPRTNEFEAWIAYLERKKEQKPAEWSDAERKQLYSDGFNTAGKALAGAFMQYIDEHRPEGKMCLSNGECAQLQEAFKNGDVETIVRYIIKYQGPAKWSKEDELHLKNAILAAEKEWGADSRTVGFLKNLPGRFVPQPTQEWSDEDEIMIDDIIRALPQMAEAEDNILPEILPSVARKYVERLKSLRPAWKPSEGRQLSKPQLAEGVYYIKDSKPVSEYEDGVETDRLLIIGKYCRFYLSMIDLGIANYRESQNKAASLGEGWRCPDSFEGRTIGNMSNEIREKAAKIGAGHFNDKGWFWTNEVFDRWNACRVNFRNGGVSGSIMDDVSYVVLALSAFQN